MFDISWHSFLGTICQENWGSLLRIMTLSCGVQTIWVYFTRQQQQLLMPSIKCGKDNSAAQKSPLKNMQRCWTNIIEIANCIVANKYANWKSFTHSLLSLIVFKSKDRLTNLFYSKSKIFDREKICFRFS